MKKESSHYYPISLDLSGKKCVVVGGGLVALRKVKVLLEHGASVEVISPDLCPELRHLGKEGTVQILSREYVQGDLEGALIAMAVTDQREANTKVAEEARERGILVNVADDLQHSDFILPSYLCRGDITIAVSTGGKSPALARRIRTKLEQDFGAEYASLVLLVAEVRSELKQRGANVDNEDWQEALDLDWLIKMIQSGRGEEAKTTLLSNLEQLSRRES